MTLPAIFSRRKRLDAQPAAEIYRYDDLPHKLRVQITHIWAEVFGNWYDFDSAGPQEVYGGLVDFLRKEKGVYRLSNGVSDDRQQELISWFTGETEMDYCFDAIERSCLIMERYVAERPGLFKQATAHPNHAIAEINARMLEAQVGYQYQHEQLIRVDSLFLHKETVIPVLTLLAAPEFAGANAEFLEAHKQFRQGDYELCLTECCKAFESVLKVIGAARSWLIAPTDGASKLLQAAFNSSLIPNYLQAEFTSLRAVLESGVPTVRNKSSGHGAGAAPRVIPQHLAAFQLHQTASAILFLVSAHQAVP